MRQCYIVTSSLIGWAHTQNDHWVAWAWVWVSWNPLLDKWNYCTASPAGLVEISIPSLILSSTCQRAFGQVCHQTSNISRTKEGNKIFDQSDVFGASPAGAAPTISSFTTWHLASMDWGKTNCERRWETFKFGDLEWLIFRGLMVFYLPITGLVVTNFYGTDFYWLIDLIDRASRCVSTLMT